MTIYGSWSSICVSARFVRWSRLEFRQCSLVCCWNSKPTMMMMRGTDHRPEWESEASDRPEAIWNIWFDDDSEIFLVDFQCTIIYADSRGDDLVDFWLLERWLRIIRKTVVVAAPFLWRNISAFRLSIDHLLSDKMRDLLVLHAWIHILRHLSHICRQGVKECNKHIKVWDDWHSHDAMYQPNHRSSAGLAFWSLESLSQPADAERFLVNANSNKRHSEL